MNKPEKEDFLLTSKEVTNHLHISRATLYQWLANGEILGQKIGSHWRFWASDVQARIVAQPQRTNTKHVLQRAAEQAKTSEPQSELSWRDYRMMRYVNALVEAEQPASEEDRQRSRDEWYAQGEDAVVEAMRYLRRKIKQQRAHVGREYDHATNE